MLKSFQSHAKIIQQSCEIFFKIVPEIFKVPSNNMQDTCSKACSTYASSCQHEYTWMLQHAHMPILAPALRSTITTITSIGPSTNTKASISTITSTNTNTSTNQAPAQTSTRAPVPAPTPAPPLTQAPASAIARALAPTQHQDQHPHERQC